MENNKQSLITLAIRIHMIFQSTQIIQLVFSGRKQGGQINIQRLEKQ